MKNRYFLLLIFLSLAACGGRGGVNDRERFEEAKSRLINLWDTDRNGVITCSDVERRKILQFGVSDENNNELLEVDEVKKAPWGSRAFPIEFLNSYDLNNDGEVDLQEFIDKPDDTFQRMDNNQDCTVSEKEIETFLKERRPRDGGVRGPGGRPPRP